MSSYTIAEMISSFLNLKHPLLKTTKGSTFSLLFCLKALSCLIYHLIPFFNLFCILKKLQFEKTQNKWKIFYKEIIKNWKRKYSTCTYLTALSNRTLKKSREGQGGGEVDAGGKKMDEYLKLKWATQFVM